MAAGAFVQVGYNDWFTVAGLSVNAPDGIPFTPGARGIMDPFGKITAGPLTIDQPIDAMVYPAATASVVRTYADDFYNRIYISPPSVDLGAITDTTDTTVTVWNAYLNQPVNLLAVNYEAAAGLALIGTAVPTVYAPLQLRTYTLRAGVDGPAVLDELVGWLFDLPWQFQQAVTGTRAKLFNFDPDWGAEKYQISYDFMTEVLNVSRNGKEQRIALRSSPRKTVTYEAQLQHDSFRRFKDLIWYWQNRAFLLPELTRFVDSTGAMGTGEDAIQVAAVPDWLTAGTLLVLDSADRRELRVVEEVDGTSVIFKTTATSAWPAGTRLYAGLFGYLAASVSAPRITNAVATVSVAFSQTPISEKYPTPPAATTVLNGREVFLKRHNWAETVDSSHMHDVDVLDYDRGPITRYTALPFGAEQRRCLFLNRNADEAAELLDFYRRMLGRQGEFYMPTWEYDFVPKGTAGAASAALRVAGTDLADSYGSSTVHRAMFVMLNNGTVLVRKVTGVARVSDSEGLDSVISVVGTWGTTISTDTIVMCGWMPVWRLASDTMTVEWLTNSVCQVQLTMLTLEDLAPETP